MTEIVQTPTPRRSSHRPMIGALLAVLMLAGVLAVAPVSIPLVDDVEPASADRREFCYEEWVPTRWIPPRVVPGFDQGRRSKVIPGYWELAHWEVVCHGIAHSHWYIWPANFVAGGVCAAGAGYLFRSSAAAWRVAAACGACKFVDSHTVNSVRQKEE